MRSLGDELSARTVQIIFESMVSTRAAHLLLQGLTFTGGTPEQLSHVLFCMQDIDGFITLDQFIAIYEAEAVRAHTAEAKMLRRMARSSSWWTQDN